MNKLSEQNKTVRTITVVCDLDIHIFSGLLVFHFDVLTIIRVLDKIRLACFPLVLLNEEGRGEEGTLPLSPVSQEPEEAEVTITYEKSNKEFI